VSVVKSAKQSQPQGMCLFSFTELQTLETGIGRRLRVFFGEVAHSFVSPKQVKWRACRTQSSVCLGQTEVCQRVSSPLLITPVVPRGSISITSGARRVHLFTYLLLKMCRLRAALATWQGGAPSTTSNCRFGHQMSNGMRVGTFRGAHVGVCHVLIVFAC
jgi:hypothetical protein